MPQKGIGNKRDIWQEINEQVDIYNKASTGEAKWWFVLKFWMHLSLNSNGRPR